MILADWDAENAPRGEHGVLISEATDPAYNPYNMDAQGRFVAEPVADYAQDAIERAMKERRKAMGNKDDDWALRWRVRLERATPDET